MRRANSREPNNVLQALPVPVPRTVFPVFDRPTLGVSLHRSSPRVASNGCLHVVLLQFSVHPSADCLESHSFPRYFWADLSTQALSGKHNR
jgi:hypothetical protein